MEVLLTLGGVIVVPIVRLLAVFLEASGQALDRRTFLRWMVFYWLAVGFLLQYGVGLIHAGLYGALSLVESGHFLRDTLNLTIAVMVCGVIVALEWLFMQRVVRRARAAGMGRTIAFLSVIPFVNMLTTAVLLWKRDVWPDAPEEPLPPHLEGAWDQQPRGGAS